jgi:rubredoxin
VTPDMKCLVCGHHLDHHLGGEVAPDERCHRCACTGFTTARDPEALEAWLLASEKELRRRQPMSRVLATQYRITALQQLLKDAR